MANTTGRFSTALKGWFLPASLILLGQAGALHVLSITERILPTPPLQDLPPQFGGWQVSSEEALEPDVQAYLKPDSYVLRNYDNRAANASVNLFVAYFKSLQNSYGPHSPKVCLPGSGWLVQSSRIRPLPVPGRAEGIPVNEYVMEKGNDKILVLYWYQNSRNAWAEEFKAKLTLLPDLIRYKRSDVSLVRLVAPMRSNDSTHEIANSQEFARLIFPALVESFGKSD